MSDLPDLRRADPDVPSRKKRSAVSLLDDGLLIVGALVAALILLKVLSVVAGTIFFVIKLLAVAAIVFVVLRYVVRSRSR